MMDYQGEYNADNLSFSRVIADNAADIKAVYDILKECGDDMYQQQGLVHWHNPYPIEALRHDTQEKAVYLVSVDGQYIATFQLMMKERKGYISKLAVRPSFSGHGVGTRCLSFMARLCKANGLEKMALDVYDQSTHAIMFYHNNGFVDVGTAPTKHLKVVLMEKEIL